MMIIRPALAGALALSVLAAPLAAEAQQAGKVSRIGILWPRPAAGTKSFRDVLVQELRELGRLEGQNIALEERYSDGRDEVLGELAANLVALKVDVILTPSERATRAARQATTAIPIVFLGTADPVASGHVASFARPGGNLTGLYPFTGSQALVKPLEFLRDAIPGLSRVAVLWNPPPGSEAALKTLTEEGARQVNVQVQFLDVRSPEDFDLAFTLAIRQGAGALYVPIFPVTFAHRAQIVALAAKHRLPTAAAFIEFAHAGGLMGYGSNWADLYRRAAYFVDQILKGAKPADLPVEQPTRLYLVINLKTAKALGLTIPQSLLLRADEVIQ